MILRCPVTFDIQETTLYPKTNSWSPSSSMKETRRAWMSPPVRSSIWRKDLSLLLLPSQMGGEIGARAMFSPKHTAWHRVGRCDRKHFQPCEGSIWASYIWESLAVISHLAPALLKLGKAVTAASCACLYHCLICSSLVLWSCTQTNSLADTEHRKAVCRK